MTRTSYLVLTLLVGGAIRIAFFTGLALGDDTFYALQSMAMSHSVGWPPQPYHWFTRLGLIGPTSVSLRIFGPVPAAFVVAPFVASLAAMLVSFHVALIAGGETLARKAVWLHAFFPLEVIYATHLFPDVLAGTLCAGGILLWIRAMQTDRAMLAGASGLCFAVGYLVRETAIVCAPVLLFCALARWNRVRWSPLALAFLLPVIAIVASEMALYAASTGDALYRVRAMSAQQNNPRNITLPSWHGGGFWTDPVLMLLFSQDIGPFFLLGALGAYVARRRAGIALLVAWLAGGFLWTYYGTTVPWRWLPLHRDPRYAAFLVPPAVALVACLIEALPRRAGVAVLSLVSLCGVGCAALDQGASIRRPHAALIAAPYAGSVSMEPLEFYGAWWEYGLRRVPAFFCASDAGRASVVTLVERLLPGKTVSLASADYFAVSPTRRPDLVASLEHAGWTPYAAFPGSPTVGRRVIGRVLAFVPTQNARAQRLLSPPGLLVLRRPRTSEAVPIARTE